MNYKLLEFDTQLFGFKVAKILLPQLSFASLHEMLDELAKQKVRLVYWPSDSADETSQLAAVKLNGVLCSKQVTYLIDLKKLGKLSEISSEVEIFNEKKSNLELKELALLAGTYSHFRTDPNFPQEFFVKLYHVWIENSVNGSIAERVLVVRRDHGIVGMITVGTKSHLGDIGLLAVDQNFRNQQIGTKLVRAAQTYFVDRGLSEAQVVTQKANISACHLYEKCGFYPAKIENFYHFWL